MARACSALTHPSPPVRLAPGIAADFAFELAAPDSTRTVAERLRAALEGAPADIIVQPGQMRRKKLLLADMDSTMIGEECIDELAGKIGKRAEVAAITERAMRGELAFEPALRERVALLKGMHRAIISDVLASRISLTRGGLALVQTMQKNGAYTVLVSGGFSVFTCAVAKKLGFDAHQANELLFDGEGRATGLVLEPILGARAKLAALLKYRDKLALHAGETLAIGDGANDLPMLEAAGLGVAFHAKPKVAAAAHARIGHGDLTALLYAQGYRREDFVAIDPSS